MDQVRIGSDAAMKTVEQLAREANQALAQYRRVRNITTLLLIAVILSGIMVAIIYSL